MSYSTTYPLHQIDKDVWLFVLICVPGWTGGFIQIFTAYTNARRDKTAGSPIAMTVGLLVHDFLFMLQFRHFFHDVDHLYWKLYWVGVVPSVLTECVLIGQWVRYNADDVRGTISQSAFAGIFALMVAAAFAVFLFVRDAVGGDPLDLYATVFVQNAAVVFLVPWILSRRSTRGQSRLFCFGTLIGPASLGLLQPYYLSSSLHTWQFFVLMGVTTALAAVYWLLFEHFRRIQTGGIQLTPAGRGVSVA